MTSINGDTRVGKGRVHPGPSPASPRRSRLRATGLLPLLGAGVVLVATVASSVFGTQAHQYSSPAALALVAAFGSFFGVAIVLGIPSKRSGSIREWLPEVLAGAAGFALAPWLVMANRYTDAPPGSEVIFFSVASWGAMLAIALAVASPRRLSRIGGTVLALAGAAGVLANWERPSSFSPFVRYFREEAWMLFAGILWVALVLVLLAAARRGRLSQASLHAALGGVGSALLLAALALVRGGLARADFSGPGVWAFGVAVAFGTAGILIVIRSHSAVGIASAYLITPATMSLLLLLENVLGSRGPNPFVVVPIVGAAASTVAALFVLRGKQGESDATLASDPPDAAAVSSAEWVARVLSTLALASAAAALVMPGMTAVVRGLRTDGADFQASFGLHGYEVAGTWLAVGVALAAFGMVMERDVLRDAWLRLVALVAAVAAWPFAASTPLRTLTSFIPSDVQVDYGSEFARIDFSGGPPVLALVALGGALAALAVLLSRRASVRSLRRGVDRKVMSQ